MVKLSRKMQKYHKHGSQYTTIRGLFARKILLNFANRNKNRIEYGKDS